MIDYSKSIAFCKENINKINSILQKIGKGRMFLVWHYIPKGFDDKADYKLNFITMILNINSLFYDCMPWFFCKKSNKIKKSLADIIKEMTSIDYDEVNNCVIKINQIRNCICHNTKKIQFVWIKDILLPDNPEIIVSDWVSFNFDDTIWEKCFDYLLKPIDDYFTNVLSFFQTNNLSEYNYKDEEWNIILKSCYCDSEFITNMKTYVFPDLYNSLKASNKVSVNRDMLKQIEQWKRRLNFELITSVISKDDFNNYSRDGIRPEKYYFDCFNSLV